MCSIHITPQQKWKWKGGVKMQEVYIWIIEMQIQIYLIRTSISHTVTGLDFNSIRFDLKIEIFKWNSPMKKNVCTAHQSCQIFGASLFFGTSVVYYGKKIVYCVRRIHRFARGFSRKEPTGFPWILSLCSDVPGLFDFFWYSFNRFFVAIKLLLSEISVYTNL